MNNVRRRRRRRRRLNPEFVKAWTILLTLIAVIVIGLIFIFRSRTSASADEGIPSIPEDPSAGQTVIASLDYRYDEDVAELTTEAPEPEIVRIDPQRVLDSVELTVPRGQLYNKSWLAEYKQQVETAVCAYEIAQEPMPDRLYNMSAAYSTMYYLCYVATTDVNTESVLTMLAKTSTNEIGVLDDSHAFTTANAERAAVIWCVLNRVNYDYPNLFSKRSGHDFAQVITKICKAQYQFAYRYDSTPYEGHEQIAFDVVCRWVLEGYGLLEDVGRTLPANYRWFHAAGDGWHNRFRTTYDGGSNCEYWYWTLPDPYLP